MNLRPLFGLCAVAGLVSFANATDIHRNETFFDSVTITYERQYRECTGSTGSLDRATLIDWKNKMDLLARTSAYIELAREYRHAVDSVHTPLPCKVMQWNEERKKAQMLKESVLTADLLAQQEADDAHREADSLAKSPLDFEGFPFGLTRRTFEYLYKQTFGAPPVDMETHEYGPEIPWGTRTFLTAFYFDTNDRFCKYEIESSGLPSNRLNSNVRPDAEFLSQVLTKRIGEPSRRYTFGIFDIKSGALSLYKTWDIKGFSAYVGISVDNYKYYAKAVVVRLPVEKAP
jgi:hypothetical protein